MRGKQLLLGIIACWLGAVLSPWARAEELPDLAPAMLQVPTAVTGAPKPSVTVAWGVTNQGLGPAAGQWFDYLYCSTDSKLDELDWFTNLQVENGPLATGGIYWRTNTVPLPVTQSGDYYLIFKAAAGNALPESNTNNNVVAMPITLHLIPPDLAPLALQVPSAVTGAPNPTVTMVWGVTNQGIMPAQGYGWPDGISVSSTGEPARGTSAGNWWVREPVAAGESYWRTNDVQVPVVQSGTYYLTLETDAGNWLAETNLNNNRITLPVTFHITPADLAPLVPAIPPAVTGVFNFSLTVSWGVTNLGPVATAGMWQDEIYFSTNAVLDYKDALLCGEERQRNLEAHGSYWRTDTIRIPVQESGTYYLIFATLFDSGLYETNKSNNLVAMPVTFNVLSPDLVPMVRQVPAVVTGLANPTLTLVWGLTNQGVGAPAKYQSDCVYLSTDAMMDASDQRLVSQAGDVPAVGTSAWWTNTIEVPVVKSGTYYLLFAADADQTVLELNEGNNLLAVPVTFNLQLPDLKPVVFQVPTVVTGPPNPSLTITWAVTNQGVATVPATWYDRVYFSTNPVLDGNDGCILENYRYLPLAAGDSYSGTNGVRVPVAQSGTYYLIFATDAWHHCPESEEGNNTLAVPIAFQLQPPDLAPLAFSVSEVIPESTDAIVRLVWGVTNQGIGLAAPGWAWRDRVYLSTRPDAQWGGSLVVEKEGQTLAPGESYWQTNTARLPVYESGSYYLIFQTDAGKTLDESNETNNTVVVPLNLPPADLAPMIGQVPSFVTGLPNPSVTVVWGVTNRGSVAAIPHLRWHDRVNLSADPVLDSGDPWLAGEANPGIVAAGDSYWWTNTIRLPVINSGNYYLLFSTFPDCAQKDDSDLSNNVLAVPMTVEVRAPDLLPLVMQVPQVISFWGSSLGVSFAWAVTNQGPGTALGPWEDLVYWSADEVLEAWDTPVVRHFVEKSLSPGNCYIHTEFTGCPAPISGTNYLILVANEDNALYEPDQSNNEVVLPVTVPDLAPVMVRAPSVVTGPPNVGVSFSYAVTNQGSSAAMAYLGWVDQVYLSTSTVLDGTELALDQFAEVGPIAPGRSYWRSHTVYLPGVPSGDYFFLFRTDAGTNLFEVDKTNNVWSVPVRLNLEPPDLAPIALLSPSVVTGGYNPRVTIAWGVTNQGLGAVVGEQPWVDRVYFSADPSLHWWDLGLCSSSESGPLGRGSCYWRTNAVRLPVTQSGTYYLIFETEAEQSLYEWSENNNVTVTLVTFNLQPPDLVPVALLAPPVVAGPPHSEMTLVWGVTNQSASAAEGTSAWSDQVYLSHDTLLDEGDLRLCPQVESGPVLAGQSYWRTNQVRVPAVERGSYYLLFKTDSDNCLFESDESNNVVVMPISLQVQAPDLALLDLQVPGRITGPPYPSVTLVWAVTNQGPGAALGGSWPWADTLYLSPLPALEWEGWEVGSWPETNTVPVGGSYWRTNTVRLPLTTSGTWYLVLAADEQNLLDESDYRNNTRVVPITFEARPPDLAPVGFLASPEISGPDNSSFTLVWGVTNQGSGPADGELGWMDQVFLSTKTVLDGTELPLGEWQETNSVPAGGSYWRTNTVHLPETTSGRFYLLFLTEARHDLAESTYSNNVAVVPVSIQVPPPDLAPVSWQVPAVVTGSPMPTVTVVIGITNQGVGPVPGNCPRWDGAYVSTSPFPGWPECSLGWWSWSNTVPAGGSYWITNTLQVPVIESGTYYLFFTSDLGKNVVESDEENNVVVAKVTFELSPPPDLIPLALQVPALVTGPTNPTVTLAWQVANQGFGPVGDSWYDSVSLSAGAPLSAAQWPVLSVCQSNILAAGADYWQTNTVVLPVMQSGTYYLTLAANAASNVFESAWENNNLTVPVRFELSRPIGITIGGGTFLENGSFQLVVSGAIGGKYILQASMDLVNWSDVVNFTCVGAPTYVVDPSAKDFGRRFYRVAVPARPN